MCKEEPWLGSNTATCVDIAFLELHIIRMNYYKRKYFKLFFFLECLFSSSIFPSFLFLTISDKSKMHCDHMYLPLTLSLLNYPHSFPMSSYMGRAWVCVHSCNVQAMSRTQCLTALPSVPGSHSLPSASSMMFSCPWKGDINVPCRAEHTTDTYSKHFQQLWVSVGTTAYCKRKLLQPNGAALVCRCKYLGDSVARCLSLNKTSTFSPKAYDLPSQRPVFSLLVCLFETEFYYVLHEGLEFTLGQDDLKITSILLPQPHRVLQLQVCTMMSKNGLFSNYLKI